MSNIYIGMGWIMEIIIWIFIFLFVIGFFSSEKMKDGNDKAKPFKLNRDTQQKTDNNVSQFSSVDSILGTAVDGLETFNTTIGELNDYVRLHSEVQKAVSSLEQTCSFEKMAITTCLEMAKNELSIEDRFANDEQGRKRFDANLARMKEAVSSSKQSYESHLCIDLIYTCEPHSEQKIEDAIQHKYKDMVECYTEFLNKTTQGLKENPRLRVLFEMQMKKYEPDLLMRIHCFEAGGEWRYIRSFRVYK